MANPWEFYPAAASVACDTARLLDEAEIPHLLWGELAVSLVGRNQEPETIEFVIPDEKLHDASEALIKGGWRICDKTDCCHLQFEEPRPVPDVHFDLKGHVKDENIKHIYLFKKSLIIWWLPPLTLGPPPQNDPHYMLSKDPRLPRAHEEGSSGPWMGLYPAKILTPNTLADAIVFLLLRDLELPQHSIRFHWNDIILDLLDNDFCPPRILQSDFQQYWTALNRGTPFSRLKTLLMPVRVRMLQRDLLPPSPASEV